MPVYTKEEKILLAIDAIASAKAAGKKTSVLHAAKTYGVSESSLRDRMNDRR
jgi:DNA-binding LytR/AlgR family response regulator